MAFYYGISYHTAATWTSTNPVLYDGQEGIESDTGRRKLGNGALAWTALAYQSGSRYAANMGATTASVSNTTTDTTLWTPSNVAVADLTAGVTMFRVRFGGNFDNIATSGTFTAKIKINGTTIASIPIAISQTGAATLTTWWAEADVFIDVLGATGSVTAIGHATELTTAGGAPGARNGVPILTTTVLLNLTAGCQFTLTGQMGTANAGNVLRIFRASITQAM